MQFHQYDKKGMYEFSATAQESPMEPGQFMMPANATLIAPPEHNASQYVIWVDDQWEMRQRQGGVYWHKKTLEVLEVADPVEIDLSDYVDVQPPAHHPGDSVEFKNGDWLITLCNESIFALRSAVFAKIKEETNRRVRTIDNRELTQTEWLLKSQNYQDVKATFLSQSLSGQTLGDQRITQSQYDHAVERINRKDRYVRHYHTVLKPMINAMTVEELQSFNPENKEYWENFGGQ